MTLVLDGSPDVLEQAPPRRWRRWLLGTAVVAAVALVAAWVVVAQRPPLQPGGWAGWLDARPLGDGLTTTRHVLSAEGGEQVVLSSIRNDGPAALTVLGADDEQGLSWVRLSFRERGQRPDPIGYSSAEAARAAVTASSVVLEPGAYADVLLVVDPPADLVVADGSFVAMSTFSLAVEHLGLRSTRSVPLLQEPLTVVSGDTFARLEREGRFAGSR